MTTPSLFADAPRPCTAPPAASTPSGPFVHLCSAPGCTRWGSHGIGVFRGVVGRWWCECLP